MVKINHFILNTNPHCYFAIKLLRVNYIWHSYMNILMLVNRILSMHKNGTNSYYAWHIFRASCSKTLHNVCSIQFYSVRFKSEAQVSPRNLFIYIIHYVLASPYYINISLCIAHKCLKILLIVCFCGLLLYT